MVRIPSASARSHTVNQLSASVKRADLPEASNGINVSIESGRTP
jgi:hypothetical protein